MEMRIYQSPNGHTVMIDRTQVAGKPRDGKNCIQVGRYTLDVRQVEKALEKAQGK